MGVQSTLEPVLSFPLGSNVMSLLEVAQIYETLTSGKTYYHENSSNPGMLLIDKIEGPDGQIIYQSDLQQKKVIDDSTTLAVSDILRNEVKYGKGRFARRPISIQQTVSPMQPLQASCLSREKTGREWYCQEVILSPLT